ncbi:HTH-type transcriptional activator CmpR [Methylacidimicrobium cyclopophantes]|uniref:HTH-type transcriptional activator CmpR n=1 Tax=Methylacidimicrobium cyclopophantes TaxID=1041766 RepID=A0A5E6MHE9_9BACT|nr:HTH-type transcriptional activator CmpR [Methylacidimicrobium cyclopophantes]
MDAVSDSPDSKERGLGWRADPAEDDDPLDLNPSHLVAFALVAELGSVSLAARRLHVVQAAVSAQLRRLRESVGDPLCRFEQGHVRLTPAGEELRKHALRVAEAVAAARDFSRRLQRRTKGRLRIALTPTIGSYYLPCPLVAFQNRYPGIRVDIETGPSRELIRRAEDFDLVFVEEPMEGDPPPAFVRKPWIEEEILVVARRESKLARAFPGGVALRLLHGERVVWREADSGVRRTVERAFGKLSIDSPGHVEVPSAQGVIEAARAGLGVGFVAARVLPEADPELAALRVDPPHGLWWSLAILAPPSMQRSAAAAAFLELLRRNSSPWARGGNSACESGSRA